jgi:hypothetical protein
MTVPRELAAMQQWLLATIADPAQIDAATVCNRLTAGPRQSPAERLSVYQQAYFARLLEVLRELFPCTRFAIGDATFDELATAYLLAYPPRSYTLTRLADRFAQHLDQTRPQDGEWSRFVVELATLEEAIDRIFDGPGPELLPKFALPADANEHLRLALAPGCELFRFQFPVSTFYSDWKAGAAPTWPQPEEQHLVLWRRDYIVRRCELSSVQYRLLAAIHRGDTLGAALAAAAGEAVAGDELVGKLHGWFQQWSAGGLFSA